jgi:hypothetical protein
MYYNECTAIRIVDTIEKIIKLSDNYIQAKELIEEFIYNNMTTTEIDRLLTYGDDSDESLGLKL